MGKLNHFEGGPTHSCMCFTPVDWIRNHRCTVMLHFGRAPSKDRLDGAYNGPTSLTAGYNGPCQNMSIKCIKLNHFEGGPTHSCMCFPPLYWNRNHVMLHFGQAPSKDQLDGAYNGPTSLTAGYNGPVFPCQNMSIKWVN